VLSSTPFQNSSWECRFAAVHESVHGTKRTCRGALTTSALEGILLQKSKVASVRIFGETLKREAIDDSDNLNRVTEVAYEFSVRR
jgi:hypothetical protein